jgi:hypothetical protein
VTGGTYERAMLERIPYDGGVALRVFPVDGVDIFDQDGRQVWCWNSLSIEDQQRLIDGHYGPLITARSDHGCTSHARVALEFVGDASPGPRFYCIRCAVSALVDRWAS